ncbi:hypothetical protein [Streptomyces decoyicus]
MQQWRRRVCDALDVAEGTRGEVAAVQKLHHGSGGPARRREWGWCAFSGVWGGGAGVEQPSDNAAEGLVTAVGGLLAAA